MTTWEETMTARPAARWDTHRALQWMFFGFLAFMPLTFGAVNAWSQMIALGLVAILYVCVLLPIVYRKGSFVWTWAYLPLALFILWTVLQLLPLPPAWLESIAPAAAHLRSQYSAAGQNGNVPISLYPQGTRDMLAVVILASLTFIFVLHAFRRPEDIRKLLLAIVVIGFGIALVALLQDLSGASAIYWIIPLPNPGGITSGTFANYNNFSQFMNLSIGAALGVVFSDIKHYLGNRSLNGTRLRAFLREPKSGVSRWVLAAGVVCAIAVPLSTSRGGTISLAVATVVTAAMVGWWGGRGRGLSWLIIVFSIAGFAGLLLLGFDRIYDRMATLYHLQEASGGRWQMNGDVLHALPPFLRTGIGLGAHEMVYPSFTRDALGGTAGHLENEYLQLIEELGIPGGICVAGFLGIILSAYLTTIRSLKRSLQGITFGLGFGIVAVLVHSATDFGQRVPAIACLTATFCALIINVHKQGAAAEVRGDSRHGRALGILAGLLVVLASGLLFNLVKAFEAEQHWKQVAALERHLQSSDWAGADDEYVALIGHALLAAEWQPDNIIYRCQLDVYRWYGLNNVSPSFVGPADNGDGPNAISAESPALDLPADSPEYKAYAQRIVDDLHAAALVCPTYGPLYCLAGQIERMVLHDPRGEKDIRTGYELAPSHSTVCFVAGIVDVDHQDWQGSLQKFKRCRDLHEPLRDLVNIYVNYVDKPDLAVELIENDSAGLVEIASQLHAAGRHPDLADQLEGLAYQQITDTSQPSTPQLVAWAGGVAFQRKDDESAIHFYQQALIKNYAQVGWRLQLARALSRSGRKEEALHEARICQRLKPQANDVKALIATLLVSDGGEEHLTR